MDFFLKLAKNWNHLIALFSQKQNIQRKNSQKYFHLQILCRKRQYFFICKFCHFWDYIRHIGAAILNFENS